MKKYTCKVLLRTYIDRLDRRVKTCDEQVYGWDAGGEYASGGCDTLREIRDELNDLYDGCGGK
jgi:hypothetical protein